jgi:lipoate-protein ligase A
LAEGGPVEDELRRHEELLRDGRPASRVAVVRGVALSYGVRVPADAPYLRRARTERIPTVARASGGTGLLHLDGDLVWALVVPRDDPRARGGFVHAYALLGAGVVRALARLGLPTEWGPPPGLTESYCPLSSRGEVLWAKGAVLGAAAQHATARAVLHHGSLSVRVDRSAVARLFELPSPGPADRLGAIADAGLDAPPAVLADELARSLEERRGR